MDDVDEILKLRRPVSPRAGLEDRILEVCAPKMVAFILLPRPFLMMVLFVILGFGLGLFGADYSSEATDYLDLFIEDDEFGGVI